MGIYMLPQRASHWPSRQRFSPSSQRPPRGGWYQYLQVLRRVFLALRLAGTLFHRLRSRLTACGNGCRFPGKTIAPQPRERFLIFFASFSISWAVFTTDRDNVDEASVFSTSALSSEASS